MRDEQPEKAEYPILVTLLGIVVFLQPLISVLVAVSITALQLLRLSYITFPCSTTIEAIESHPLKAPSPIFITLLGIVTEVKEEQLKKAEVPMLVTLLGIVTEVREEFAKANSSTPTTL